MWAHTEKNRIYYTLLHDNYERKLKSSHCNILDYTFPTVKDIKCPNVWDKLVLVWDNCVGNEGTLS